MQSTAQNRQSLADITIEKCGSIEAIFDIADRNGLAITDDPHTGQVVECGSGNAAKQQLVLRLESYGVVPATGIVPTDADNCPYGGIGYMGVEYDFTVR